MYFYAPFIRKNPSNFLETTSGEPPIFFSRGFIFTFADEEKKHDR